MRCHICNATLNPDEVSFNRDHEDFDPCGRCLAVINEVFDDHLTEEEIDVLIENEDMFDVEQNE